MDNRLIIGGLVGLGVLVFLLNKSKAEKYITDEESIEQKLITPTSETAVSMPKQKEAPVTPENGTELSPIDKVQQEALDLIADETSKILPDSVKDTVKQTSDSIFKDVQKPDILDKILETDEKEPTSVEVSPDQVSTEKEGSNIPEDQTNTSTTVVSNDTKTITVVNEGQTRTVQVPSTAGLYVFNINRSVNIPLVLSGGPIAANYTIRDLRKDKSPLPIKIFPRGAVEKFNQVLGYIETLEKEQAKIFDSRIKRFNSTKPKMLHSRIYRILVLKLVVSYGEYSRFPKYIQRQYVPLSDFRLAHDTGVMEEFAKNTIPLPTDVNTFTLFTTPKSSSKLPITVQVFNDDSIEFWENTPFMVYKFNNGSMGIICLIHFYETQRKYATNKTNEQLLTVIQKWADKVLKHYESWTSFLVAHKGLHLDQRLWLVGHKNYITIIVPYNSNIFYELGNVTRGYFKSLGYYVG